MVTSSAVVGSSAISSLGSQQSAMAIATRWRMPPESWCGYCRRRCSGAGMPTSASSSAPRLGGCRRVHVEMRLQGLDELRADGEHGIERRHRILEDDRELGPPQAAQRLGPAAPRDRGH